MTTHTDLSCRTAREWLQSPEGLAVPDSRLLTRHLEHCGACRQDRAINREIDAHIVGSLDIATAGRSVRTEVLTRLQVQASPVVRSRTRGIRRPRALSLAGAFAAAILLALFAPQMLSRVGDQAPRAIAWRAMRPEIGYPVTVDPRSPNHLLAGAWGQVYESRNGGVSWRRLAPLPAGNIIRAVLIESGNPSRYLVATKHSVYRSVDAGQHWSRTADSLPGAMNMFLVRGRERTVYLGPSVLWKSADGGRSWEPSGPGYVFAPDGIQALAVAADGTLVAGIWGGGVAVSHDTGASWHRRAYGLPRNVMDVTTGSPQTFWAGTDRGVFRTTDAGSTWHARGLTSVRVTALLVRRHLILAGGTIGMYRSLNGGRSWQRVTAGLPLDPYVAGFSTDPTRPNRVFASLNTDGIFRSDDGGTTWMSVTTGLPLGGSDSRARPVLFLRAGRLWVTTAQGADPGLLTVENTVRTAAVSPDGTSVAYVAATGGGWEVRVLSAGGGSLAQVIAHGSGDPPSRLGWSPTSTRLALLHSHALTISDLHGDQRDMAIRPSERFLGWSADGRNLLFWSQAIDRVVDRSPEGTTLQTRGDRYPDLPVLAPDHRHLAFVDGGDVWSGTWSSLSRVAHVSRSCRVTSWSGDSSRLLLACRGGMEIRARDGTEQRWLPIPSTARWAPGSHDLLFFRGGALWRWDQHGIHRLVSRAAAATSS